MENNIKKGLAALAISTALLGSTHEALAEETTTAPQAPAETTEVVETATTTPVTVETVTEAKETLDEASLATKKQEEIVADTIAEVTSAETEESAFAQAAEEAQALKEQATPEAIAKAEADVVSKETAVTEAETEVVKATEAVAVAKDDVTKQETVVTGQEEVVASQESRVADATKAVENAQALLDGTGASQIYAEQEEATKALDAAKTEEQNATTNLTQAESDKVTADKDLVAKQATATTAQAESNKANQALAVAQTREQAAKKNLDDSQAKLTAATEAAQAINTITLSDEYVRALKVYSKAAYKSAEHTTSKEDLKAMNGDILALNTFKSNPSDKERKVDDVNNLSIEVRTELSHFASDLVNQIRKSFNTPLTAVTTDSVALADRVGDLYHVHNWGWEKVKEKGHDDAGLEQADKEFRVSSLENLQTYGYELKQSNMDVLKRLTYQAIVSYMLNGREWLHAESIAGLASENHVKESTYFGIGVSSVSGATNIHAIKIPDDQINKSSPFSTTKLTNPNSSETILTNLKAAQTAHGIVSARYEAEHDLLTGAKSQAVAKGAALSRANSDLLLAESAASTATRSVETAKTRLATAKKSVETSQARKTSADQAVASLKADITVKQDNLTKAKEALGLEEYSLAVAKNKLAKDNATLSSKKATLSEKETLLTQATSAVNQAKSALEASKEQVANLKNADANLARAIEKLTVAKAKVAELKAKLKEQTDTLSELKKVEAQLSTTYSELLAKYNAQLRIQREEIVKSGKTPVEVVNKQGLITGYKAVDKPKTPLSTPSGTVVSKAVAKPAATVAPATKSAESAPVQGTASAATLPNTGATSGTALSLMGIGSLLSGLGLTIKRRKTK